MAHRPHIDKTIQQCSKCHMRDGHVRRRCPWPDCPGPESCNDLEKHPSEKKMVSDASSELRAKEKEVERLERDMVLKKSAIADTQKSFKYQVLSALINTNVEKYTFATSSGRAMRQTVINNDVYILEKHHGGKIPRDIKCESTKFQNIIADFNRSTTNLDHCKRGNPVKPALERHGVIFPKRPADDTEKSVPPKKRYSLNL